MRSAATIIVLAIAASVIVAQPAKDEDRAAKWDKEVAAIEKRQTDKPPDKGDIVFAGSSTIRLWDLAKSFPDWKVTNSGFGGSEIRDSTLFADRLIYVDMVAVTLGADGQPKPEFFVKDGLHLSEKGYRAWSAAIKLLVK